MKPPFLPAFARHRIGHLVAGIRILHFFVAACVAALSAVCPVVALADIDSMGNFVIAPNSVGLGMMVRTERSM